MTLWQYIWDPDPYKYSLQRKVLISRFDRRGFRVLGVRPRMICYDVWCIPSPSLCPPDQPRDDLLCFRQPAVAKWSLGKAEWDLDSWGARLASSGVSQSDWGQKYQRVRTISFSVPNQEYVSAIVADWKKIMLSSLSSDRLKITSPRPATSLYTTLLDVF